ncbi:hypothetical protein [Gottfriedia acidiceleris]|nr:hypothetical protein [Gottfriedia acidiceleris]
MKNRILWEKHIAYWTKKQNQGIALVFGSVRNLSSPHGIELR